MKLLSTKRLTRLGVCGYKVTKLQSRKRLTKLGSFPSFGIKQMERSLERDYVGYAFGLYLSRRQTERDTA